MKKFWEFFYKKRTKNYTQIPLISLNFNWEKYKENKREGNCMCHYHPSFKNDVQLNMMIQAICDYIRGKYNMEDFTKFSVIKDKIDEAFDNKESHLTKNNK